MILDMKTSKISAFLGHITQKDFSIYQIIATFLAIISVRFCIELWTLSFAPHDIGFYFFGFLHTTLFFYIIATCCIWLLVRIANLPVTHALMFFLYGFLLVIFPPIIDYVISITFYNGTQFLSYYLFDSLPGLWHSFLTFFGNHPRDGITYGTRIVIALTIFAMSTITYYNTKKIIRALLIAFCTYSIFFFFSALPSFLAVLVTNARFATTNFSVASLIASPTSILNNPIVHPLNAIVTKMTLVYILIALALTVMILYKTQKNTFLSLLKNIRPIQSLYHIGLVSVGMGTAVIFGNGVFIPNFFSLLAILIIFCAAIIGWYGTVVFNDIIDIEIDKITNATRPLVVKTISVRSYNHIGIACTLLSLLLVACINYHATIALIFYHALSFLYNTPPLHLKRFPIIATFTASLASFCLVIMGYVIITDTHSLQHFPPHIAFLLITAYTISLPIKDLKDIEGDKKNRVYTIPVICGERIGRLFIASGIFISFALSIFTFNNLSLLWPSLLAGTLCFWTLIGTQNKKFIFSPHASVGIVFVIVSLFGIILTISLL